MRYAFIDNGIVYDSIEVRPETVFYPDYAYRFVQVPDEVRSGWTFDGEKFSPPPGPTLEMRIAAAREKRDGLLAATDWTQAVDVPQALKDKWAPYRQALRDVPQQPGFPDNIQWPVQPE